MSSFFTNSLLLSKVKEAYRNALDCKKSVYAQTQIKRLEQHNEYGIILCTILNDICQFNYEQRLFATTRLFLITKLQNSQCCWLISNAYLISNGKIPQIILEWAVKPANIQVLQYLLLAPFNNYGMTGILRLLKLFLAVAQSTIVQDLLMVYFGYFCDWTNYLVNAVVNSQELSELFCYAFAIFHKTIPTFSLSSNAQCLNKYPLSLLLLNNINDNLHNNNNFDLFICFNRCQVLTDKYNLSNNLFKILYHTISQSKQEYILQFLNQVYNAQVKQVPYRIKNIVNRKLKLGQQGNNDLGKQIGVWANLNPSLIQLIQPNTMLALWICSINNQINFQRMLLTMLNWLQNSVSNIQMSMIVVYIFAEYIVNKLALLSSTDILSVCQVYSRISINEPNLAILCYDLISACIESIRSHTQLNMVLPFTIKYLQILNESVWTHRPQDYQQTLQFIVYRLDKGDVLSTSNGQWQQCHIVFNSTLKVLVNLYNQGSYTPSCLNSLLDLFAALLKNKQLNLGIVQHLQYLLKYSLTAQTNLQAAQFIQIIIFQQAKIPIKLVQDISYWQSQSHQIQQFYLICLKKIINRPHRNQILDQSLRNAIKIGQSTYQIHL